MTSDDLLQSRKSQKAKARFLSSRRKAGHDLLASTFFSSSLNKVSAPPPTSKEATYCTSTASRNPHSHRHHPSSPPKDVCCLQVLRLLLVSSLLRARYVSTSIHVRYRTKRPAACQDSSPSTGKSSNSSSSSSRFGCEGCCEVLAGSVSGFLSSCSLAVGALPAAAPDILDAGAVAGWMLIDVCVKVWGREGRFSYRLLL